MAWLKTNFTWLTRWLAALIEAPLRFAFNLLAKGFKFGTGEAAWTLPRLSWLGVIFVMAWLGYIFGGLRLAALCGLGFPLARPVRRVGQFHAHPGAHRYLRALLHRHRIGSSASGGIFRRA